MGLRKQMRREFINNAMKKIEDGDPCVTWELWQQCPNTAVRVTFTIDTTADIPPVTGLGFAKVNWPDEWDAEEGQQIALHKAVSSIWRQVFRGSEC